MRGDSYIIHTRALERGGGIRIYSTILHTRAQITIKIKAGQTRIFFSLWQTIMTRRIPTLRAAPQVSHTHIHNLALETVLRK